MSTQETGWVVESSVSEPSRPLYMAGLNKWTVDNLKAVRFARKEDAEKFALKNDRVCEHSWG